MEDSPPSKRKDLKQNNDDNNNKYKLLRDFLNPIIKEERIRQILSYYKRISKQNKYSSYSLRKTKSNKTILDYSFITFRRKIKKKKGKNKKVNINNSNRSINSVNTINKNKANSIKYNSYRFSHPKNKSIFNSNLLNLKKAINQPNINNNNDNINNNKQSLDISSNKEKEKENKKNTSINKISNNNSYKSKNKYLNKTEIIHKKNFKKFTTNMTNEVSSLNNTKKVGMGFTKWYNYGKEWEKIKNLKKYIIYKEIEEKKDEMIFREKIEETFRPKISQKSIDIVNKNYPNDFYERLIIFEKRKKLNDKKINKKYSPLFKPNLNKTYNNNLSKKEKSKNHFN